MSEADGRSRPHLMWTDEPGLVLRSPRRQLARLLALYAALPLICAAAGSFIAHELANERTDRRIAATERQQAEYLAERREANAEANRIRDAQLAQFRRDLCVVIDRAVPRDPEVVDLRRRYGCGSLPPPGSPSPSPSVGPGVRPSTGGRAPVRPAPVPVSPANPPVGRPVPSGQPGPTSTAAPVPAPSRGNVVELCLPVLDLCVL